MTKETFAKGMNVILNAIPRENALKFLPAIKEEYFNLLNDLPDEYFYAGIINMMKHEDIYYMPSPGKIRKYVKLEEDRFLDNDILEDIRKIELLTKTSILKKGCLIEDSSTVCTIPEKL